MLSVSFRKVFFLLLLTILHFHCLSVNCVVPSLSVKKVDSKLIERKRQDTLEICRLFNEENSHRQTSTVSVMNSYVNTGPQTRNRIKRDIDSNQIDSPVLKRDDILKVEKIVDNLYDDLEDNGNRITYRQRNFNINNSIQEMKNTPNRRFFFRPVKLLGPEDNSTEETTPTPTTPDTGDTSTPVGHIQWAKKWKHGVLPYYIDPNTYDVLLAEIITKAFDYFGKVSCIRLQRLREKPTDKPSMESVRWLYITNPSGIRQCVHSNEQKANTGVQMVVLGYDCLSRGEIAHEVMHVLGFSHEHTRADRDRYITILWDNIKPGYKKYFDTRDDKRLLSLPYDYASVLHYPPRAFSKNGQPTVMAKTDVKVGQREALSELDVEKIGIVYRHECVARNQNYLMKTCPSVIKNKEKAKKVTPKDIKEYFKDRIWPLGVVNYDFSRKWEFTPEERENLQAVFDHIEKETCIKFRDITGLPDETDKTTEGSTVTPANETDTTIEGSTVTPANETDTTIEGSTVKPVNETDTTIEGSTVTPANEADTTIQGSTVTPANETDTKIEGSTVTPANETEKKTEGKNSDVVKKLRPFRFKMTRKLYYDLSRTTASHARIFMDRDSSNEPKGMQARRRHKAVFPKSPSRRHIIHSVVLTRSSEPGCQCPTVSRPVGNQTLTINGDCFNSVNDLLHLFVHVLGLDHQHKMHDRDSFVHIEWNNLTPEIKMDMEGKLPAAASAGFAYDYQSVMHYPWLQIKNGFTNIMYPIWITQAVNRSVKLPMDYGKLNDGWAMGHWQGLSWVDVQKINLIYAEQCNIRPKHSRNF